MLLAGAAAAVTETCLLSSHPVSTLVKPLHISVDHHAAFINYCTPCGETASLHSQSRLRVIDAACDARGDQQQSVDLSFLIQCMVCFPGKTGRCEKGDVMGEVCAYVAEMCIRSDMGCVDMGCLWRARWLMYCIIAHRQQRPKPNLEVRSKGH